EADWRDGGLPQRSREVRARENPEIPGGQGGKDRRSQELAGPSAALEETRPVTPDEEGDGRSRGQQVVGGPRLRERKEKNGSQNPGEQEERLSRQSSSPNVGAHRRTQKNSRGQRQEEDGRGGSEDRVGVEVGRLAASEKSKPVLVDEVEPGEPGLSQRGENVPRQRDCEEEECARGAPAAPEAPEIPSQEGV